MMEKYYCDIAAAAAKKIREENDMLFSKGWKKKNAFVRYLVNYSPHIEIKQV